MKVVGWVGAIFFWVVLAALLFGARLPLTDAILVAVLLVAVPTLSAAQLPLVEGVRVERLPAYYGSITALWLLGSASWLVGTRTGGAAALGLGAMAPAPFLLWSLGLTAAGLVTMLVFRQIAMWTGADESPVLRDLLPRTRREKGVFALLSVAAGAGEELAYRGYSIPVLAGLFGTWGAGALTSVVFGALHAYQGWLGTARTALMGGILAWGFLASESLWPAIVAHTAIDLLAGLVLGEKLLPPSEHIGVVGAPERSLATKR